MEDTMARQGITRRHAIGIIGTTGIALTAEPSIFLSLKTSATATPKNDAKRSDERHVPAPSDKGEKVVISGAGSSLKVAISGPIGRHCGVVFASTDRPESYRAVKGGQSVIGEDGVCTIKIDTRSLPDRVLFIRVVTGSKSDFSRDAKGTQVFKISISAGLISEFLGVCERPMESAEDVKSAATAGYDSKAR
jgi:hypothetical protein